MIPAFFEIFMAMVGAMMTGASVLAQDSANNQNIALAKETLNQQQKFSEEAAETAQQRQIDMYKQFFSPEAMTQQYKEAGLNPSLIYAKGGVGGSSAAGAQATTPAAAVPYINPLLGQGQMAEMMNVVKTLTEAQKTKTENKKTEEEILNLQKVREQIDKQIEKADSEIKLIEEQANTQVITQTNIKLQNDLLELQKDYENKTLQDRINTCKESLNLIIAQEEKTWEEINGLSIDNKYKGQLYHWQIEKLQKEVEKLGAEKLLVEAQKVLTEWQQKNAEWQNILLGQESDIKDEQKKQAEWNTKMSEQEYEKAKYEAKILEEKVKEYQKYGAKIMESNGWAQTLVNLIVALGYKLDKNTYGGGY